MGQTDLSRGEVGSERTDPNSDMNQTEQALVTLGQTEQTQGPPWTTANGTKTHPGPDQRDPIPGSDRRDPKPTLDQTEQTQDLDQAEQTQDTED